MRLYISSLSSMSRRRCSRERVSLVVCLVVSLTMPTPRLVIEPPHDRTVSYGRGGFSAVGSIGPRLSVYMPGEGICPAHDVRFGVVCGLKEDSMSSAGEMHRRSFLVGASVAGGGLALGFAIPRGTDFEHPPTRLAEVNCWVTIAPDDMVTIRIARAEMGQGAMTGLAMLVAEEL